MKVKSHIILLFHLEIWFLQPTDNIFREPIHNKSTLPPVTIPQSSAAKIVSTEDEFITQVTEFRQQMNTLTAKDLAMDQQENNFLDPINDDQDYKVKYRYKITDPEVKEESVRRSFPRSVDRNRTKSIEVSKNVNFGEIVILPSPSLSSSSPSESYEDSDGPPPLPDRPPPLPIDTSDTQIFQMKSAMKKQFDKLIDMVRTDKVELEEKSSKTEKNVKFLPPAPETVSEQEFKPIQISRSTENLSTILVKPIPVYPQTLSKSTQDLSKLNDSEFVFRPLAISKSSDDILLPDIDGIRKISASKYKKSRPKSEEILNRMDEDLYANLPIGSFAKQSIKPVEGNRKPHPLPRTNEGQRTSKTIVYVLDKEKDHFVLEDPTIEDRFITAPIVEHLPPPDSQFVKINVASNPSSPRIINPTTSEIEPLNDVNIRTKSTSNSKRSVTEKFTKFCGFGNTRKERDANAQSGFYGDNTVESRIVHVKSMENLTIRSEKTELSTFKSSSKDNLVSTFISYISDNEDIDIISCKSVFVSIELSSKKLFIRHSYVIAFFVRCLYVVVCKTTT